MTQHKSNLRRSGFRVLLLGIAGLGTTFAAVAAVPMIGNPKSDVRTEQAAPQPLPTLTSGRGIRVERAFGSDDEDCSYVVSTQGSGLGLHEVRTLSCGE